MQCQDGAPCFRETIVNFARGSDEVSVLDVAVVKEIKRIAVGAAPKRNITVVLQ
jgi:YVTN family beta-propeller protein